MMKRSTFVRAAGLVAAGSIVPVRARAGPLAPPPQGFSSNTNYFLYGGGKPIQGLRVTIDVDQDIVAPQGMSMQLNCNSPANTNCAYQQYVTNFDPSKWSTLGIVWIMENFPSRSSRWHLHKTIGFPCNTTTKPSELTCSGNLFNYPLGPRTPFARFSVPNDRIPAGFKLIYELIDGPDGAIIGAKYTVVDNRGRRKSTGPHLIHKFQYAGMKRLVGPEGVAPILAFQMNLVGLGSGLHTTLTSGAGRITYEATTPLTAEASLAALPGVFKGTSTSESSNIGYFQVPAAPNRRIVQRFSVPHVVGGGIGSGGLSCPQGQTYNSLDKKCETGRGKIIINDKAPPGRPPR